MSEGPSKSFLAVRTTLLVAALTALSPAVSAKPSVVKKEKHFGQVFTPSYLVQDILNLAGYMPDASILEKHVIDNSCGDGAFLDEVVRRYVAAFRALRDDEQSLARQLGEYVHGIELDKSVHKACLDRLDNTARELGIKDVHWDVRQGDALKVEEYDGKMDFVVGNPPYVRVHNLAENFNQVKQFKFSTGGMTDLYLVFYEIGLKMLSRGGVLSYIAPSSWMNSLAGKNMRDYLYANRCITSIVDLGHFQPFRATAYTAIVTLCRDASRHDFRYGTYSEQRNIRWHGRLSYEESMFSGALHLGAPQSLKRLRKISETESPQYVTVKNGFATLADGVFIADEFPFADFVIPVLKASTGKWRKGIFPYDDNGRPLSRDEIFGRAPVANYLLSHKDALLKGRDESIAKDWHLYGRTQALKDVAKDKYAVNTCVRDVNSVKLTFAPAGSGVYSGLYILTEVDPDLLRKVLLDEGFVAYVAMLRKYKSGGYYTFSSQDLERYLNYELDRCLPKSKRRALQKTFDM